jgi:hypothetical protein
MMSQQIIDALQAGCHGLSPSLQIAAMQFLHEMEGSEGMVRTLLQVIQNPQRSFSDDCRLLATICLKNNVDRCWTSRGENMCVPLVEKELLRQELFNLMGEESDKISIQLAVLAARIARHDFPNEWPKLFETIFHHFETGDWITCTHAVSALLQILLTLHAKRLAKGRAEFRRVCLDIIEPFSKLWSMICSQYFALDMLSMASDTVTSIGAHTNLVCTCNRILQIMTMQCFEEMHGSVFMQSLLVSIADNIEKIGFSFVQLFSSVDGFEFVFSTDDGRSRDIWASVSSWREDGSVDAGLPMHGNACFGYGVDALDMEATLATLGGSNGTTNEENMMLIATGLSLCRAQLSLAVIPLHMQKDCNRDLMTPFVSYYLKLYYCLLCEPNAGLSSIQSCEPVAVAFAVFLSNTLSATTGLDPAAPLCQFFLENCGTLESSEVKSRLNVILELVVNKLLRLPQSMLCDWIDDPEELFSALQIASETDNMRLAAEGLFSSMLYFSPDTITPSIIGIISDFEQQMSLVALCANDPVNDAVLFWDGVYTCCGLSPYFISQMCDMSQWARELLGPLLSALLDNPSCPQILQYRLVWMCGCWAHNLDKSVLSDMILAIVEFLKPRSHGGRSDLLVRLQVISTIEIILRAETFEPDMILPVLDGVFAEGCALVSELTEDNSKVTVVSLFQDIIETIGPSCRPYLASLTECMLWLWEECAGTMDTGNNDADGRDDSDTSCVLLSQMLSLFGCIAKVVGSSMGEVGMPQAELLMDKFLSVAAFTTFGHETSSHLSPDGISLWLRILRCSDNIDDGLSSIFVENIPRVLSIDAIGSGYKNISQFLMLLEEYAMRGGSEFISSPIVTSVFVKAAAFLMLNVKSTAVNRTLRLIHCLLLTSAGDGVAMVLVEEGIVTRVVQVCAASLHVLSSCDESAEMKATCDHISECHKSVKEPDSITASYLALLARLAISFPDYLSTACSETAAQAACDISGDFVLKAMFRLIIDKFDTVACMAGGHWHARICCLWLLSAYPSADSDLLDWLPEVLYIVDGILLDETNSEEMMESMVSNIFGDDIDSLDGDDDEDDDSDGRAAESSVRHMKAMLAHDFAVGTSIQQVVVEKLQALQVQMGADDLHAKILCQVDNDVLRRIGGVNSSL